MNAYERIQSLLKGKEIDRPALSLWKHFPVVDKVPEQMIGRTTQFQEEFGWDFIKICYNGLYSVEDWGAIIDWPEHGMEREKVSEMAIKQEKDWDRIGPLDPYEGALGRELKVTEGIVDRFKREVPVLATVFSPLTTGIKMCGERIFQDMEKGSGYLMNALETIMETTIRFTEELIKIGIDGVFFATQLGTYDRMDIDMYRRYGEEFDRPILELTREKTWFSILHLHGQEPMFEELNQYPVEAINWHDRKTAMNLGIAVGMTDKILIGGIDEHGALKESDEEGLRKHVQEALEEGREGRIILGPGCVVPLDVDERQFALLKRIVSDY